MSNREQLINEIDFIIKSAFVKQNQLEQIVLNYRDWSEDEHVESIKETFELIKKDLLNIEMIVSQLKND